MQHYYSVQTDFFGCTNPHDLVREFGSPLYIYNEKILRQRCREMKSLIKFNNFQVNYSTKANSNLKLLRIIHDEGLHADAMSPGEIHVLLAAGFLPEEIFYISNNVSEEEMEYAISKGVKISVDSLSQLEMYGRLNPGGKIAVRFNPGVGAGHHEKVVTGGEKTKFGVNIEDIDKVKEILKKYSLKLVGINQHIGSLFMEDEPYIQGVKSILNTAEAFEGLEFIDLGGGFGIPYRKLEGEKRLNLEVLGENLTQLLQDWSDKNNVNVLFKIEPGRYLVAESGILVGTVNAIKTNHVTTYVGTDVGFNVLMRPILYDSHHDIEVYKNSPCPESEFEKVTIVGNICESGDIIGNDRLLPKLEEKDLIGILDAGAYGYCMASNYNNRLRPAEVLIRECDGMPELIRRRDTLDDLLNNYNLPLISQY